MRLYLALALLAVTGCGSFGPGDALLPLSGVSTDPATLTGEHGWFAVAAVSDGAAYRFPPSTYTVRFATADQMAYSTPLTGFFGTYAADANGSLVIGEGARAAVDPVSVSRREQQLTNAFVAALHEATRFETSGYTLQVYSPDGDGVRFEYAGFRAQ